MPFVDARYRTLAGAEHRGITGKSSGGYGAMVNPMLRPDVFGGLATHAGDALFEMCYLPDFRQVRARAARPLRRLVRALLGGLPLAPAFSKDSDHTLLERLLHGRLLLGRRGRDGAAARTTPPTGELRPEIWERWLAWDPVRMAPERGGRLALAEGDLRRLRHA